MSHLLEIILSCILALVLISRCQSFQLMKVYFSKTTEPVVS